VAGLLEIAGAISSELDFRTLLKVLAQKTAQICGADRCTIYLLRDGAIIPAMSQYASGVQDVALWRKAKILAPLRLDDFVGFKRALEHGTPIAFTNPIEALPRSWVETFHVRSGLILPLLRGKRWVGVIHLNNSESARAFDTGDVELARAIAVQLALVIDNARLVEETRGRLRDTETLLSVGQTISSTLDLMEVVRRIARAAANALGADTAGVYLTSDRGTLDPLAGYRVPKRFLESIHDAALVLDGFRTIGTAMRESTHTLWSDDVPNDPRFGHEVFRRVPLQSVLITSVRAKDEFVGILVCSWWERKRRFAEPELELVRAIAAQAAIAIMNARLYAKAEELAVNRERVRVAHALHDRLSQSVFSLGLRLEWCLHHTPPRSSVHAKLRDVWHEARSIMAQMRQLIYRLSPESPTGIDLPARVRTLVADFEELSGVVVKYEQRAELTGLESRHEDILFKTLQEGFANIVKHARAAHVSLILDVVNGAVTFALADDGVGPPPGLLGAGRIDGSHGLRQMVERIEGFGGRVELSAVHPSGFAVRGSLPLPVPG
jgi:signal transduction histidine kinase